MEFRNEFDVGAPRDEVLAALVDLERVVPCVPGAEVAGRDDDGATLVALTVKVGPISLRYRGRVVVAERDDANARLRLHARVRDVRGQGTTQAVIALALADVPGGTRVTVDSDVAVTGKVAQLGQGVMTEVAAGLVERFARNLEARLATPDPAVSVVAGTGATVPKGAARTSDAATAGAVPAPADAARLELAALAPIARRWALPALLGALVATLVIRLGRGRGGDA